MRKVLSMGRWLRSIYLYDPRALPHCPRYFRREDVELHALEPSYFPCEVAARTAAQEMGYVVEE